MLGNFKIWIKSLDYELIDTSTAEKINYVQSKTIVYYKFAKGLNVFDGSIRINKIVNQTEAMSIITNELNAT